MSSKLTINITVHYFVLKKALTMSKVQELEKALDTLSEEEFDQFRRWIRDRDFAKWDKQIEEDSLSGKLDFLIEGAIKAKEEGMLKPL